MNMCERPVAHIVASARNDDFSHDFRRRIEQCRAVSLNHTGRGGVEASCKPVESNMSRRESASIGVGFAVGRAKPFAFGTGSQLAATRPTATFYALIGEKGSHSVLLSLKN